MELGKQLASHVREEMKLARGGQNANLQSFVPATARLLQRYWAAGGCGGAGGSSSDSEAGEGEQKRQ